MLLPFLPVDEYATSGPVTDSVNVSNQDHAFCFCWDYRDVQERKGKSTAVQTCQLYDIAFKQIGKYKAISSRRKS